MNSKQKPNEADYQGKEGGAWDRQTHEKLYGKNLNTGLGDFVLQTVAPLDFLEFGSGLGGLASYIAERTELDPSYCIEPEVELDGDLGRNVHLLNLDILSTPTPEALKRRFDMVISIEVIEHIPLERHTEVFDFLVARAGRIIVFSAARPGQGGHGHVAERPELEWREEFLTRGCRFDPELTARARTQSNERNINHRKNLQIFHVDP